MGHSTAVSPISPMIDSGAYVRTRVTLDVLEDYSWTTAGQRDKEHQQIIAVGGYGEVHRMMDHSTEKVFARKIVRPFGSLSREDIETEMTAIDQLNKDGGHPNIINVFTHAWAGYPYRFFYIDMELCDTSLHHYIHGERCDLSAVDNTFIRRDAPILNQMLNVWIIMLHISEGVEYIRSNKQVHRDLKPQNILYSAATNSWKIADFGCTVSGTTTKALTTVFARGTASYRAPELLKEHPVYTNKVDIWAIGCILFELVTGKVAFAGDWEVHEFAVSGSKIQLPNSAFPKLFQSDVSTSVDAILRPDPPQRPDASHICSKFRSYIEQLSTNPEPLSEAKLDPYEPRADDSEAIADWKGLVKRNPNSLPLQKRLSDAYRKEGKLDLEIAILERIVNKDPSSVYYSDMLTEAYDKRRKMQGWSDQSEVEENDKHPEDWVVVDESSEIAESKPPRKASDGKDVAYWKERVYKKPGDLDLQTSLVKAFRKQGDIEGEIATFNDLIRRFPSAWYLADQVANAYKEKGDMDEAIENWIDLVHMEPANTWWQVRLAEAYEIKKDKVGEIQTWRDFVKMYPDIESLQDRLATAYERK